MSAVLPASSTSLAADLEACYPDIVRQLTRSTGCPDRARELAHDTSGISRAVQRSAVVTRLQ